MAEQPSSIDPQGPPHSADIHNPLVSIERVVVHVATVRSDVVELVVSIPPGMPRTTAGYPGSADTILRRHPGMARHRCQSGSAHGIKAELANTEVAHLLEHLIIELLAEQGSPRGNLHGATAWNFAADGQGVYRVRITGAPSENSLKRAVLKAAELIGQLTVS